MVLFEPYKIFLGLKDIENKESTSRGGGFEITPKRG
jgi:hypothetical protein